MRRRIASIAAAIGLVSCAWSMPAVAEELPFDVVEQTNTTTEQVVSTTESVTTEQVAGMAEEPIAEEMGDEQEVMVETSTDAKTEDVVAATDSTVTLQGRAHVQNIGWKPAKSDSPTHIMLGTTGQSLRVEALEVSISGADGNVVGRAHVQNEGWKSWTNGKEEIGTTGKSQRIEAMRLKLTGMPDDYHLYYRVHVQNLGWLAWTHDGELAGTAGRSLRLESVEIKLVRDGEAAPSTEGVAYVDDGLSVKSHVQNIGWQSTMTGTSITAGTTGQSLRMEAFTIAMPSTDLDGAIRYEAHVQDEGWQTTRSNGQMAGSVGMSRHVEAVRISLTGALDDTYDLWYRVHVSNVGWLDWTKDGKNAGSTGRALPIEALELRLLPEGANAPGPTASPALAELSGDARLDSYLAIIVNTKTGRGADALRKAYDYVVNNYTFKDYGPTPSSFDDWREWSVPAAREFYEKGNGNCYRFSALFCWLARALDYDASCYIGWVKSSVSGFSVHSWVEIPIDGTVYAFDPDMQRFISSRDFFKMSYGTAPVYYYDMYQRELT